MENYSCHSLTNSVTQSSIHSTPVLITTPCYACNVCCPAPAGGMDPLSRTWVIEADRVHDPYRNWGRRSSVSSDPLLLHAAPRLPKPWHIYFSQTRKAGYSRKRITNFCIFSNILYISLISWFFRFTRENIV